MKFLFTRRDLGVDADESLKELGLKYRSLSG